MGNKKITKEENTNFLDEICDTKCPLIVGFDFEQQGPEDAFDPLPTYDNILESVLIKHPDCESLKFYQAGNTRNHSNKNIKYALEAGAKRISNCSNILQFS